MSEPNSVDAASLHPIVMRLSKTQTELLEAMKTGVICWYMPYMGRLNPTAYYYRSDTMKRCTAAARALLKKGLVEKKDRDWRGHKLVLKSDERPAFTQPERKKHERPEDSRNNQPD